MAAQHDGKRHRHGMSGLLCGMVVVCMAVLSIMPVPAAPPDFSGAALQRWQAWKAMMDQARDVPVKQQLKMVNDFFNRNINYVEDEQLWGREDYWATPWQTIRKGAGDCEDFVIAKYASLRKLGVSDDHLRLIYVRARLGGADSSLSRAHMVLGFYSSPTAVPLVLDSLLPAIDPASRRPDLKPIFSFNARGLWAGTSRQTRADPLARLSRWRKIVEEMRSEGFPIHD